MNRRAFAASGFTAAVVLAVGVLTARLQSWRPPAVLTHDDGAAKADEATTCRVTLELNPTLNVAGVRVGTSRWSALDGDATLDYEHDMHHVAARLRSDGVLLLFVESYEVGHSEWYELEVAPGASSGDVLVGCSESHVHGDRIRPRHVDGVLTLSALPQRIGDRFAFDLRASVSTGWSFHAQAEVEVDTAAGATR